MTEAPVSVIIPFYQGHGYLPRALAAVAAQTVRPGEIIIVDDASDRPLVHESLPRIGVPIRVVEHAVNRGIPAARNTGVRHAREEWIAFLDQDDEWLPDKLSQQWKSVQSAGATARRTLFYGQAVRAKSEKMMIWPSRARMRRLARSPAGALRDLLLRGNLIPLITTLIHRSQLDAAGGFDERWRGGSDDFALLLMLAASGTRFHGIPQPLAVRHETGENFSSAESFLADDVDIIRHITAAYPATRPYERAAVAAAHFRCARGVAAADPARARELFDESVRLHPMGLRARLGRVLLFFGPRAGDIVSDARDRVRFGPYTDRFKDLA